MYLRANKNNYIFALVIKRSRLSTAQLGDKDLTLH